MAVGQRLTNGYIVLLLTPREATDVCDELLHPEAFPWQSTESQRTTMEVRSLLRSLTVETSEFLLGETAQEMARKMAELDVEGGDEPPEHDAQGHPSQEA